MIENKNDRGGNRRDVAGPSSQDLRRTRAPLGPTRNGISIGGTDSVRRGAPVGAR